MGWGLRRTNLISFVSEDLVSPLGARGVIKMSHQPTAHEAVELPALDARPPPPHYPSKNTKQEKVWPLPLQSGSKFCVQNNKFARVHS